MEPISLTTVAIILVSMGAGAVLSNLFGKKKSCCGTPSEETTSVSIDEGKEKDINDLIVGKKE